MALRKPPSIKGDNFKSAKWDEITSGRNFQKSDVPTLEILCQWYAIAAKCMEDMYFDGDLQIAYTNDMGDIKALPQLASMKQASAEIRAINKQLGIKDEAEPETKAKVTKLNVIQARRKNRGSGAANTA